MQGTDIKAKKQKVISIVRDINISKDDLLDYLKTIDIEAIDKYNFGIGYCRESLRSF